MSFGIFGYQDTGETLRDILSDDLVQFDNNLRVNGTGYFNNVVVEGKITGSELYNNAVVQGTPHLILNNDEEKDAVFDTGFAMKYKEGSDMKYAGLYLEKDTNEFILYKNGQVPSADMNPNALTLADMNVSNLGVQGNINLGGSLIKVLPVANGSDITSFLQSQINDAPAGSTLDLSGLRDMYVLTGTIIINKPLTLLFGPCEIVYMTGNQAKSDNNYSEANYPAMFRIDGIRNVTIKGTGRLKGSTSLHGTGDTLFRIDNNTLGTCILGRDCDGLRIEDCSFTHSMDKAGSNGIKLYAINSDNISYISFKNVFIAKFSTRGLYIEHPVTSIFENVRVSSCVEACFYLATGTSCTLNSCYASGSLRNGFKLDTMTYTVLNSCASEACGTAFSLDNCFNITLSACGAERQNNRAIKWDQQLLEWVVVPDFVKQIGHGIVCVSGGYINIDNFYYKDPPSYLSSMIIIDSCRNVVITTPRYKVADAWEFKDPAGASITLDYGYSLANVESFLLYDIFKANWTSYDDLLRRLVFVNGDKEVYLYVEQDFAPSQIVGTGWKGYIGNNQWVRATLPHFYLKGNNDNNVGIISFDDINNRLRLDCQGPNGSVRMFSMGQNRFNVRPDRCEVIGNLEVTGEVSTNYLRVLSEEKDNSSAWYETIFDPIGSAFTTTVKLVNTLLGGGGEPDNTVTLTQKTFSVSPTSVSMELPLLLKSYTNAERDALTGISTGHVIYNSSSTRPQYYSGGAWHDIVGLNRTTNIYNIPTGTVGINKVNPTAGALDVSANLLVSGTTNLTGALTLNNRLVMNGSQINLATLSSAERDLLANVANGSLIHNSSTGRPQYRQGGDWHDVIGLNRTTNVYNIPSSAVGINKADPTAGALDVSANLIVSGTSNFSGSSTFGNRIIMNGREMVLSSLTTEQRDALPPPSNGSMIFNTTTNKVELFKSGAWSAVDGAGADLSNYATLNTSQNFTASKTFINNAYNNTWDINASPTITLGDVNHNGVIRFKGLLGDAVMQTTTNNLHIDTLANAYDSGIYLNYYNTGACTIINGNGSGSCCIGASNPTPEYKLLVSNGGATKALNVSGTSVLMGNVGIGVVNPTFELQLSTDSAGKPTSTLWTTTSDMRLKDDIVDANTDTCLDIVKNIKLHYFKWNEEIFPNVPDRHSIGFIAQEVQQVFPKAVKQVIPIKPPVVEPVDDGEEKKESNTVVEANKLSQLDDYLTLDADQLYKAHWGATQKLISLVEQLQNRVTTLETRLNNILGAFSGSV